MEAQKTYQLKQWYTKKFGVRELAYGTVYGHPDFEDGQRIHTSYITGQRENSDGSIKIETYVGNCYLLKESTIKRT